MNNYFKEVNDLIINYESNKKVREIQDNSEDLLTKWNIGRLLVEAQSGEKRAKYGDNLIKEWGEKLAKVYGKSYSASELRKMRQYFIGFRKRATLSRVSWSQIKLLLPIKNESERNYYINQVILNNLSVRELRQEIKSKSYDRLSYVDKENIKLIENDNYELTIEDMIKDPILLKVKEDMNNIDEKALHKLIINMLENKFLELGTGFALIGHEYKLVINNKTYKIDLLFFNIKINSYVVIEVKTRELKNSDISQLQFYVNYIDKNIKSNNHNKTIGLLIVKKKNKFVIEYTINNNLYITTYKIIS